MRWSLRLGTLFDIPVYVHPLFLALLGLVALAQGLRGGLAGALGGVTLVLAIFACVVLHEFGHALAARRFGIATRDVTLLPIGGLARLERNPDNPRHELWIALAGPAVNVAIAAALGAGLLVLGPALTLSDFSLTVGSFAARLLTINVVLAAFNMLPAFPMDGGRVLRALLAQRMSYVDATDLAATIGRGMALLLGLLGLLNPMLIFIAFFVWFGAGREAQMVRLRAGRHAARVATPPVDDGFAPDREGWRPGVEVRRSDDLPRVGRRFYRVGPWIVYQDEGVR